MGVCMCRSHPSFFCFSASEDVQCSINYRKRNAACGGGGGACNVTGWECILKQVPYFPEYKPHWSTSHTLTFCHEVETSTLFITVNLTVVGMIIRTDSFWVNYWWLMCGLYSGKYGNEIFQVQCWQLKSDPLGGFQLPALYKLHNSS